MAMLAAMRQLLEEKRRLEKQPTRRRLGGASRAGRVGPRPGLEAAVAAAEKFAAEARTPHVTSAAQVLVRR